MKRKQVNLRLSEKEIANLKRRAAEYGAKIGIPVILSVYARMILFGEKKNDDR